MKKYLTLGIAAVLLLGCREKTRSTAEYTIDGEIAGVSGKVYLTVFEGKQPQRIDSAEIENGVFFFSGEQPVPILAGIETPDAPLTRFFLENSAIQIDGSADRPDEIRVEGSKTNDLFKQHYAQIDSLEAAWLGDSLLAANPQRDSLLESMEDSLNMDFVRRHPESAVATYVLFRELSYGMTAKQLRQAVGSLAAPARSSVYADLLNRMADALEKTEPGKPYTDISAPDSAGVSVALSSLVGEDKYVLIDFWASWCPPCRAEMPALMAVYKAFHPKGLELYGVSLDRNKKAWTAGIRTLGVEGVQVSELEFWNSPAAATYAVRSIPSNVLIGPDGTILARNLSPEQLQQKLAGLLETPAQPAAKKP